jgi:hypothetical protein
VGVRGLRQPAEGNLEHWGSGGHKKGERRPLREPRKEMQKAMGWQIHSSSYCPDDGGRYSQDSYLVCAPVVHCELTVY